MNSIDVLYNLPGVELEASDAGVLEEVEGVCDALSQLGIEHRKVGLSREGFLDVWPLLTQDTLVFNLCEGLDGEAGFESLVAGVLELYHIPFTGSSSRTLGLCQDKAVTKALLSNAGVPCVPDGPSPTYLRQHNWPSSAIPSSSSRNGKMADWESPGTLWCTPFEPLESAWRGSLRPSISPLWWRATSTDGS